MKKADFKLIIVVALICALLFIVFYFLREEEGSVVEIQVNGEVYGTYPLNRNQTIGINDTNVLVIENGEAYMSEADCPDKLCIHQGHISQNSQMIICLPNRVVVQIKDSEEDDDGVDSVAG